MSIFASTINDQFEQDPEDRIVFYGLGRNGFIIDTTKEKAIRSFLQAFYSWLMPISAASAVIGIRYSWLVPMLVLIAAVVWYQVQLRRMLAGSPQTTDKRRRSLQQRLSKQAAHEKLSRLWQLEAVALAFALMGLWLILSSSQNFLVGLITAIFGGVTSVVYGYMIAVKLQQRRGG